MLGDYTVVLKVKPKVNWQRILKFIRRMSIMSKIKMYTRV